MDDMRTRLIESLVSTIGLHKLKPRGVFNWKWTHGGSIIVSIRESVIMKCTAEHLRSKRLRSIGEICACNPHHAALSRLLQSDGVL
jgi:hypothetical protein